MFRGLTILMIIAILAITGFQAFWLRENYEKEKRNLEFRSNVVFREAVRKLQAKKLNLYPGRKDSTGGILMETVEVRPGASVGQPAELADVFNDVAVKIKDSLIEKSIREKNKPGIFVRMNNFSADSQTGSPSKRSNVIISMNESYSAVKIDSLKELTFEHKGHPGDIFRFLYSVDSLQDSLRVTEVDSVCRKAFNEAGLLVPFKIIKSDSTFLPQRFSPDNTPAVNRVTVGLVHPVTFEIALGNTFSYLLKKLTSPLLFSLFLVAITIFSFVLLYRNLVKQRRLTEIKNEFIGNITHELKTPIATVGVAIEALRNFNAINNPQRTQEYLDISQNELQRLSLLVDKVLKLSMFEKKEIELRYEPLNMKEIVDEVVASLKLQIEKHRAEVSADTIGDTGLQGDRLHLQSVVFNLLDNALKYSNDRPEVKIAIEEKGNNIELSVADNGIGIAPEYKDRVFEKFFRVPAGNIHNTKGYGLGLSYVAHVVEKHKGKIDAENLPGGGAKFTVTLPKRQI